MWEHLGNRSKTCVGKWLGFGSLYNRDSLSYGNRADLLIEQTKLKLYPPDL